MMLPRTVPVLRTSDAFLRRSPQNIAWGLGDAMPRCQSS